MLNKTLILAVLTGTTLIGAATTAWAQSRNYVLNATAPGDLRASLLSEAPVGPLINTRRETVAVAWPGSAVPSDTAPKPWMALSREFQVTTTAGALAAGVDLTLDAPGAILRVSTPAKAATLTAAELYIDRDGQRQAIAALSDQLVSADDLRAAGLDGASSTVGVRLSPLVRPGTLRLVYAGALPADTPLLVSVFDRDSRTVLAVQSLAEQFTDAASARVSARLASDRKALAATFTGLAIAPDGRTYPLVFDGSGVGRLAGDVQPTQADGLWQWQVEATSRTGLRRATRTAFALVSAVARFDERVRVDTRADALHVVLGIETRAAGRYEVRATLAAATGEQTVFAATAGWLDVGTSELTLVVDAAHLKKAGLTGPITLRDLTLRDQSRMSVQERRANALTF